MSENNLLWNKFLNSFLLKLHIYTYIYMEAAPEKAAAVRPPTTHHKNYPS